MNVSSTALMVRYPDSMSPMSISRTLKAFSDIPQDAQDRTNRSPGKTPHTDLLAFMEVLAAGTTLEASSLSATLAARPGSVMPGKSKVSEMIPPSIEIMARS